MSAMCSHSPQRIQIGPRSTNSLPTEFQFLCIFIYAHSQPTNFRIHTHTQNTQEHSHWLCAVPRVFGVHPAIDPAKHEPHSADTHNHTMKFGVTECYGPRIICAECAHKYNIGLPSTTWYKYSAVFWVREFKRICYAYAHIASDLKIAISNIPNDEEPPQKRRIDASHAHTFAYIYNKNPSLHLGERKPKKICVLQYTVFYNAHVFLVGCYLQFSKISLKYIHDDVARCLSSMANGVICNFKLVIPRLLCWHN